MSEKRIASARGKLQTLLTSLNIQRVVYVDDKNEEGVQVEELLAEISDVSLEDIQAAILEFELQLPNERDLWEHGMKMVWEERDSEFRSRISQVLLSHSVTVYHEADAEDPGAA